MTSPPLVPQWSRRCSRRQHALVAATIFAVTLGVRLLFLGAAVDRPWPHSAYYEGDAILWAQGADTLGRGVAADDPLFFRSNALAHVLHWLQPSAGPDHDYTRVKILWCVVWALACAALYVFCVATGLPPGAGLLAAGLSVFSFDGYVLSTSLNTEAPYALLLVLVLVGCWRFARRPSVAGAVVLGAAHGVAIWIRIEHQLLLVMLSVYLMWDWRGATDRPARGPSSRSASSLSASRLSASSRFWARRAGLSCLVALTAVLVCLPSTIESTRAARQYNTVAHRAPAYDQAGVTWTPDARAFVDALPAFARHRSVEQVSVLAARRGLGVLDASSARQLLLDDAGALPEPLSTPVFVSGQGPLNFALANHPDAHGAFSRAALQNRLITNDPRLTLSLPPHLRLYNHGYAVGWGYIRADPRAWIAAVARKLLFFYQGVTSGFTAYNLPLGRFGERRPCDLLTPLPGRGLLIWQLVFGALLIAGVACAWRREGGRLCLLVVGYKLVVTVAFFGYARQAASILPAVLVVVALGLDAVVTALVTRLARHGSAPAAARPKSSMMMRMAMVAAAVTMAAIGVDIHAMLHPPAFDIRGPLRAVPQWGESAFSSNAHLQLVPQAQ